MFIIIILVCSYNIMLECWNEEPRKRPSFSQLRAKFDALLLNEGNDAYIVLQIDTEKPYYKMEPSNSKDRLHVSPLPSRRRSQLSVDSQLQEAEKPPSSSASASLQGSPLPSKKLHGHQSLLSSSSPCRERPPRPTSMHLLYSEQQQSNPYVEDPSKPSAPSCCGHSFVVNCRNTQKCAYYPLWQTCKVLCPWMPFHQTTVIVYSYKLNSNILSLIQ